MLGPDELLSTTRAVRRRLDLARPVPEELVEECLALALQAPSGSNRQGWHFVVVTDGALRAGLAALYARAFSRYEERIAAGPAPDAATARVHDSARYLAEHLGEVPVHLVACAEGRPEGRSTSSLAAYFGSILPAVWSFCLAARSRGLGTAFTTMHLSYEREAAELLGIPYDEVAQVALVPVGYLLGAALRAAPRRDLGSVVHRDRF
ncbi:MAG TPA: nitroreductase family protein [Acidimicrobiales bacterium]|nr:nitroreductase family protein [Acidimicrobiales bacterium]